MRQDSFTLPWLITLTLMAALLALSGCGSVKPTEPLATPQLTPTRTPTRRPSPTLAPTSTPTRRPMPTPQPLDLVVLHSNDVMGYTEPCG